jgi:DNA-binding PadR family transcriptional regulator
MERLKHQQSLLKIRKLGLYISKVLAELKAHELVECINPEVRKGRLYRLTDKGDELVKNLR